MIELALTILAGAFLAWLGFWIIFYGLGAILYVVIGPFVALKEWLDKKHFEDEMKARDREWREQTAHLTDAQREKIERDVDEYLDDADEIEWGITDPP